MICGFCQKPFDGKWFGTKPRCCSRQCHLDLFETRRTIKNCEVCGLSLRGKPLISRRCSHKCYASIPKSEQMRAKLASHNRTRIVSLETRRKMSFAHRGPKHWSWRPDREQVRLEQARKKTCYGFIWNAIRLMPNPYNHDRIIPQLGWSVRQLFERLESQFQPGMTWDNHGQGDGHWHIDHIRPISSFPLDAPLLVINSLENLRPMWSADNIRKGKKWNCDSAS